MLLRIFIIICVLGSISSCNKEELLIEEEPCVEGTFEETVIGTWIWTVAISTGKIKINSDGSYEDIVNVFTTNGEIGSRTWRIEEERMIFDVENSSLSLPWKSFNCDMITFDGEGLFEDPFFTRE